ncbi:MAG: TolC family protein [Planctomycetota bacterium]|nr:MAG: TolC family protein [Planctomycetota bacterium]
MVETVSVDRLRVGFLIGFGGILACAGCDTTLPSKRLEMGVNLPVPEAALELPPPDRFYRQEGVEPERYVLSPRTLIPIAFHHVPAIKSSYHRFKSEEARYDFFFTSRDSLTPRLRTANQFDEERTIEDVTRTRQHMVELSVEKRFFDTTELDAAVGYQIDGVNEALGYRPFVSASLRYPLWVSRQKLERTSEEIFRRNEVNDAQLAYIQLVRSSLQDTLFRFYRVVDLRRQVKNLKSWLADLEALLPRLEGIAGRDVSTDRQRIRADIARVTAQIRELQGRFDVDLERLKAAAGLPFHAEVELVDEPFNPFEGYTHEELFQLSIETDPEIATLRNAEKNAEVQLDLARRGRWDLALLLDGKADVEGGGERNGVSDWSLSFGLDISAVDKRVTDSLIQQSLSNIARFSQAIAQRQNQIYVDTFEPMIRIETLTRSRRELIDNLPRYQSDYDKGVEAFLAGHLNVDDLLKRRETLFDQQQEISRLTFILGANVAELCSATGKFFELLNGAEGSEAPPVPGN